MIEEHGKNEELSCFYFGINHEDEVSQVLILLPIKIKYYLANTPKAMLLDLNFGCGLGSYIRIKRNLWQRCKDAEGESWLIMMDVWEELQKDNKYISKLRDPRTGSYLPENYRLPNIENIKLLF